MGARTSKDDDKRRLEDAQLRDLLARVEKDNRGSLHTPPTREHKAHLRTIAKTVSVLNKANPLMVSSSYSASRGWIGETEKKKLPSDLSSRSTAATSSGGITARSSSNALSGSSAPGGKSIEITKVESLVEEDCEVESLED